MEYINGNNMSKFIHLHCHNEFSILDGVGTAEQYAAKAKELGFPALGMTNHGNVDGLIKFQNACDEIGIVPIHGCELYVVKDISIKEKGDVRRHLTVWVKNNIGWENLLKLLTIANSEGFYYRPRVSPELLLKCCDGLVVATACSSSFVLDDWGIKLFKKLHHKIGDDLYSEIMPFVKYKPQEKINSICKKLADEYGTKLLATNDSHFIDKDDAVAQEVLLAIQSKKKWKDKDRWKFDISDIYLKTEKEMRDGFTEQGIFSRREISQAILSTYEIFEKCKDFRIQKKDVELPEIKVDGIKISDADSFLKKLCNEGMDNKVKSDASKNKKLKIYTDRLEEELAVVIKQGFVKYFLIVWELIRWCKNNDIMVGPGRGSSGGSLICYLIGITAVDPIQFDLIFARFISPARIDLPDIDMDFEDVKRPLIREHLENLYGKYHVAGTSTFLTMKGRGAIKDVSRVFDVPMFDVNKASSCIVSRTSGDSRSDFTIEDAFATFEDGRAFKNKYPKVVDIAMRLEGQIRGKGQHAAAIIISEDDLREGKRACLVKGKDDGLTVNWDKHDIEHVGLMKLDVLGLNALTVLNYTARLVKENTGTGIDFENIPIDDKKIYKEFSKGSTVGCFQFGSLGLRKLCVEMGIENFDMLTHANALYRPGTLRSGMVEEFVDRKKGKKEIEYIHPFLESLTKSTFGIILYQEQVMKLMYDLGGLGWKTADTVRKVISKSKGVEQFQSFKQLFVEGCEKKKTLDKETAEDLWDALSSFGSYSFNLSHAVEYAMIAYWDMYCKIYHPVEFFCANLSFGSDNKKEDLIEEAIKFGLDVRPPKIGISDADNWIAKDGILYCPFIEIKGFGDKTSKYAAELLNENKKFFSPDGKKERLTQRFKNILDEIGSDKNNPVDELFAEKISRYFSFSFNRDPQKKFRKMVSILSGSIDIEKIKDINFGKSDTNDRFYFGRMTEIKFSYREKVSDAGKGNTGGGIYGNLKDNEDFCMLVFGGKAYQKKKYGIEHCGDEFVLVKANRPNKKTNIICNDVWLQHELLSGNFEGLELNMIKQNRYKNNEVKNCSGCDLKSECKAPVVSSTGKYNIMIIGEAPGKEEDREGVGFVGRSGELVWNSLSKKNLKRNMFNITNVVKCFPSKTRTPTNKHIKSCSKWLTEEIENIKPCLILAFGNTNIKFFTEEESGIMAKSGTTEWNEKYGCWICWCIHPASVLYSPENNELFSRGIKNFAEKVKIFGKV
jgi:DNA polymerase-3 subunit alpha